MALLTSTIGQLTLTTSAAAADLIEIEVAASGLSRKITKANFIGATLTGGGSIVTGGYTLTVPKTGTVPVGTGTDGRVAQWSGDANTLAASTLAKTGAGVLTLSAAGAYTLTVPATGTAVLLDASQTLTNKTLTTPTIGSFTNAQHNHTNAAGGGTLGTSALNDDAVTNAKLANMVADTIKGRANGAGTGDPTDLTATQVRTILNVENGADVTDAVNVLAAGALMTSGDQSASGVKTFTGRTILQLLNLSSASATIASGAITATASIMVVDTEGGAGTDDLETVSGLNSGDIIIITTANSNRDVTLKHGTGNILLNGQTDKTLDRVNDFFVGIFYAGGVRQLSFSDNQ